jgi:hypothetical protein
MANNNKHSGKKLVTGVFAIAVWALRLGEGRHMKDDDWRHAGWGALVLGVLGIIACAVGAALNLQAALQAWLFALIAWIALPLGAMAMLMCHNLTGGAWGEPCLPALKAMIAILPLIMIGFIPLLVLPHSVFLWVAPEHTLRYVVQRKSYWLNTPFLWARTTVFFGVWIALAWRLNVWRPEPVEARPFGASGGGMVAWGVTLTFFAFDWCMSLQPRFYSDIFAMLYFSDPLVVAPAATLLILALAHPDRDAALGNRMHDIANLLLAALCGWIFVNFVQYLIIWNGNLPDEIAWYIPRSRHGWQWFTRTLFIFYFALPFAALLSRRVKQSRGALLALSAFVLFAHVLFAYWLVMPSLRQDAFYIDWLVFAALIGVGGLVTAGFAFALPRRLADNEAAAEGVPAHD